MGRAWHSVRAATFILCYAPNPFGPVAAYKPAVERVYCVTEQRFVLNHCARFVRQEKREKEEETAICSK